MEFCRGLPHATEDIKWGDNLIFSIGGKMLAGFEVENLHERACKWDDEDYLRLTEREGVIPAPYAARFGWVKVKRRGAVGAEEARGLLRKSYALVRAGLAGRVKREMEGGE